MLSPTVRFALRWGFEAEQFAQKTVGRWNNHRKAYFAPFKLIAVLDKSEGKKLLAVMRL
jgi:hypothetical protein